MAARWLLDMQVEGQQMRVATSGVVVADHDGDEYVYREGLGIEVVSELDESTSVTITRPPSGPGWAERASGGVTYEHAPCTLRYHVDGQTLEDAVVVLRGWSAGATYGSDTEPLSFQVDGALVSLSAELPAARDIVQRGHTWPKTGAGDLDEDSEGVQYPVVIGRPGLYEGDVYPAYRGALVDDNAGSARSYYLIADREIAASEVTVWSYEEPSERITLSVSTYDDERGKQAAVAIREIVDGAPPQDVEIWIGHGTSGGGIYDRTGTTYVRGAGEVIEMLLRQHSSIPIDAGRMRATAERLDAYKIDTYIDKPTSVWEWIEGALLPLLPVRVRWSGEGLWLQWHRYDADSTQAVRWLDADRQDVVRRGALSPRFEIRNEFSISYAEWESGFAGHRTMVGDAAESRFLYPGVLADERVIGDVRCRLSQQRYGRLQDDPIETAAIWSSATAARVLRDRALQHALPIMGAQYSAPLSQVGKVRSGDVVLLTDSDLYFTERLCLVEEVAYSVDELLLELSVLPSVQ